MPNQATRKQRAKQNQMWKDNQTGAQYTQADYMEMQSNPVYSRLIARLAEIPQAPEPLDAVAPKKGKQLTSGDKIFDSATNEDHGLKS